MVTKTAPKPKQEKTITYLDKPETKKFVMVFKKNKEGKLQHVKTCRAGAVNPYEEAAWYGKDHFGIEIEIPVAALDKDGWPSMYGSSW